MLVVGWGGKSLKTRRRLMDAFPDDLTLWNEFGVGCLMVGRVEDARQAFTGVNIHFQKVICKLFHFSCLVCTFSRHRIF